MRTAAVFGGSYNPCTIGHLMVVAHILLNESQIDDIVIVPCFQQTGKHLIDFEHRLEMCKLNFEIFNRVHVTAIEQILGGESITIRTLSFLKEQRPDTHFRFVIGSDLKDKISTWEGGDQIISEFEPLIVGRAGITPLDDKGSTPISPLISSTMVRKALKDGNYSDAERYLTAPVLNYIKKFELYSD